MAMKSEPLSNITKEIVIDSIVQSVIQKSEPLPKEVYEKLKQENIELEGEEKKLLELSYNISKKLEKQKLSSDELENIAGGNSKFDDFLAKHPKLNKAFFVLGILETTLMLSWAIYGTYLNIKEKNEK